MSTTTVSSSFDLARTDRAGLRQAMLDGAARHPGRQAAVWLLDQHGTWMSHRVFLSCVRMQPGSIARVQWGKFATLAVQSGSAHADVAVALSAALLAGAQLPPDHPDQSVTHDGVLTRDGWVCVYCGDHADTVDHVTPVARGGRFTWDNLVAACRPCNQTKGDKPLEALGWPLRAHRSVWSPDRIDAALGVTGQRLVADAYGIRDLHAAQLTLAVADGHRAALAAMGIHDRSPRSVALMRELATRLATDIGDQS